MVRFCSTDDITLIATKILPREAIRKVGYAKKGGEKSKR
jgi:hypothetical protein